jgi:hypothetical protein
MLRGLIRNDQKAHQRKLKLLAALKILMQQVHIPDLTVLL